jgi:hypothetical protein
MNDIIYKEANKDKNGYIRADRVFPVKSTIRNDWEYSTTNNFITPEECASIIEYGNKQTLEFAGLYSDRDEDSNNIYRVSTEYRCVESCGIPDNEFGWLYDRMASEIQKINDICYGFDIRGLYENIVFLKYKDFSDTIIEGNTKGKYDWHRDTSGNGITHRKISAIVQLSDSYEYKGCKLQLSVGDKPLDCTSQAAGDLITFASWKPHRITPIEAGTRYSLVCWVTGPPFK